VLVAPSTRSRNWMGLAKLWRREPGQPSVALASSAVPAGVTTTTSTTIAK